jgi:ribosomal-protein-alanine N-acetyltransferase
MIRPATAADIAALARLHAACFAQGWTKTALRELLESPGIVALVAPSGFVLARAIADEAEILTLAVTPEARRQGLATSLVSQTAEAATMRGALTMFLEVAAANRAALALYRRLGFREAGRRKAYYGAGEDALILRADLPLRKSPDLD